MRNFGYLTTYSNGASVSDDDLGGQLRLILGAVGVDAAGDPVRCRAVVLDVCGADWRASRLLVTAIDAGVVALGLSTPG